MDRLSAAANAREAQSRLRAERIEQLAEYVAEGHTIRSAAALIGIGESTALSYWAEIKKGLGE